MGIFYLLILLTYIFAFVSRISEYRVFKITFFCFVPIMLILVSGLRSGIGDTYYYMHSYTMLDGTFNNFKFEGDFGFNILQILLYNISSNPQLLVFITALITHLLNSIMFYTYRYRNYLELQIYMYITSGYFFVTMNGIRQCLAAAIIFIGTKFIVSGNFKRYLALVLIVSTIHNSAIIMIPVYFIARSKVWSKKTAIMLGAFIIGFVFYDKIIPIIYELLGDSTYSVYKDSTEGGSSLIRTIVMMVPVILSYINREKLEELWPESKVFINISLLAFIFTAFGMYNWIFNRVTLYFQLYNMILIPFIIKNCYKGKEKRLIYWGFIACYFIFFYKEQVIGSNLKYHSNFLNIQSIFYN